MSDSIWCARVGLVEIVHHFVSRWRIARARRWWCWWVRRCFIIDIEIVVTASCRWYLVAFANARWGRSILMKPLLWMSPVLLLTQLYMMDQSPTERAGYELCLIFGSWAVQCHRPWSRECRNGCAILETVPLSHATAHSAFGEGFSSLECRQPGYYRRWRQSSVSDCCCSTDPDLAANRGNRVWHSSIENLCCTSK